MTAIIVTSCGESVSKKKAVSNNKTTSKDSVVYKEVPIGKQVWMTKNLDVAKFRNGDPIPEAKTDEEWVKAGENEQPAWCNYDNNPANGSKYGKLYNWYAVNDPRGLEPQGWHIPSNDEWTVLTDYLGGELNAGAKMKSKTGWAEDGNGTNSTPDVYPPRIPNPATKVAAAPHNTITYASVQRPCTEASRSRETSTSAAIPK